MKRCAARRRTASGMRRFRRPQPSVHRHPAGSTDIRSSACRLANDWRTKTADSGRKATARPSVSWRGRVTRTDIDYFHNARWFAIDRGPDAGTSSRRSHAAMENELPARQGGLPTAAAGGHALGRATWARGGSGPTLMSLLRRYPRVLAAASASIVSCTGEVREGPNIARSVGSNGRRRIDTVRPMPALGMRGGAPDPARRRRLARRARGRGRAGSQCARRRS